MPGEDEDAFPVLSDRSNIVVIADEAHRTQYGFEAKLKIGRKSMSTATDAANNSTVLQADTSPFGRLSVHVCLITPKPHSTPAPAAKPAPPQHPAGLVGICTF